jgi:hypothetical protein
MFYLPIYFQSIHGQSAITSGVNNLPFLAMFATGAMFSGFLVGKTRLLQPYELIVGYWPRLVRPCYILWTYTLPKLGTSALKFLSGSASVSATRFR